MLPEDPRVLLVQADRVRHGPRAPLAVDEMRVEVADLADAVAAQLERVDAAPQAVLAGVEIGPPGVIEPGLSVGDDHLRARRAVQHLAVVEAYVVQHEPLLRVDRDAQRPAVPADGVALHGEAHAVRLRDRNRAQIVTGRNRPGGVGPVGLGDRLDVALLELEHPAFVEVDVDDQALDRAGVAVVARLMAQVCDGTGDAPSALHLQSEPARREDLDLDERHVLHPAAAHRLAPARVGPYRLRRGLVVLERDRRAGAGQLASRDDGVRAEIAHELVQAMLGVDHDGECTAGRPRSTAPPCEVVRLGGLVQPHRDEAGLGLLPARELGGLLELGRRERLERMCGQGLDRHAATIAA